MPPSECPLCRRQMCDHTCYQRGQTFAEMMGDPPGTHAHQEDRYGCCCDACTAPGTVPESEREWERRRSRERATTRAFELLQEQAVTEIKFGSMVRDDDWGQASLYTDEGSCIDVWLLGKDMSRLNKGGVSHVELTEDFRLFIWTGGRRKIPVSLSGVCYAEAAN